MKKVKALVAVALASLVTCGTVITLGCQSNNLFASQVDASEAVVDYKDGTSYRFWFSEANEQSYQRITKDNAVIKLTINEGEKKTVLETNTVVNTQESYYYNNEIKRLYFYVDIPVALLENAETYLITRYTADGQVMADQPATVSVNEMIENRNKVHYVYANWSKYGFDVVNKGKTVDAELAAKGIEAIYSCSKNALNGKPAFDQIAQSFIHKTYDNGSTDYSKWRLVGNLGDYDVKDFADAKGENTWGKVRNEENCTVTYDAYIKYASLLPLA